MYIRAKATKTLVRHFKWGIGQTHSIWNCTWLRIPVNVATILTGTDPVCEYSLTARHRDTKVLGELWEHNCGKPRMMQRRGNLRKWLRERENLWAIWAEFKTVRQNTVTIHLVFFKKKIKKKMFYSVQIKYVFMALNHTDTWACGISQKTRDSRWMPASVRHQKYLLCFSILRRDSVLFFTSLTHKREEKKTSNMKKKRWEETDSSG